MALSWFDRKRQHPSEWAGFLERGVKVEGKIETGGTFRVDAAMKGKLVSEDALILGEHADIDGEIIGNRVVIAGRFNGEIRAKSNVELQSSAVVTGEIHTPCLAMEAGAVFEGRCHMPSPVEAAKPLTIPIRSAVAQSHR